MSQRNGRERTALIERSLRACHNLVRQGLTGLWLASAVLSIASMARAQTRRTELISDEPECARCTISIRRLLTIGDSDGPGLIPVGLHRVRVDGADRYWILAGDEPPMVFDSNGRFVRLVGRSGRGPGEFVRVNDAVLIPGDSIVVVDGTLRKATVFGPDLSPARDINLEHHLYPLLVLSWPASVIANGNVATPDGSGWPLHHVSLAQERVVVKRSFGPESGDLRRGQFYALVQVLAPAATESFWTANEMKYHLYQWSLDGDLLRSMERRPSWFARPSRLALGNIESPPDPAVTALRTDDTGLLWLFARVPAPSWRRAWPKGAAAGVELDYRQIALDKMFRTVVEVINPRTSRVVARRLLSEWVVEVLPAGRVAIYSVGEDGVPHVLIAELRLLRR